VGLVEDRVDSLRATELQSAEVGEAVMRILRDVDEVAYVRFASVYRAFENVDQFIETIRPLRERV
jgi:transcriptional repressor NrdR